VAAAKSVMSRNHGLLCCGLLCSIADSSFNASSQRAVQYAVLIIITTIYSHKNEIKTCPISTGQFFGPKTALTLDGSRVNDP